MKCLISYLVDAKKINYRKDLKIQRRGFSHIIFM